MLLDFLAIYIFRIIYKTKSNIGILVHVRVLQSEGRIVEIPGLVEHTKNGTAGQGGNVLVIVHDEGILADQPLMELIVQFFIVGLCIRLVDEGLGVEIFGADIYQHFTIIRTAHQMLNRVDQAEMTPVLTEDIKAYIGSSVLIGGILCQESFDYIKILIQGVDLRISCPLQNLLLKEEGRSVDLVYDLLAIGQTIVRNDIQYIIAILVLRDQTGFLRLNMCPQTRCGLGADIVKKVDQGAVLDKKVCAVSAVEQIRIILSCDHHAELLVKIACKEFKLKADAEFIFDLLIDLVVICRLVSGISTENSQGNGLRSFLCHRLNRKHGSCCHDHCQ